MIDRARLDTLAPVNLPPAQETPAIEVADTRVKAPSQRTCSDCGAQSDKRTCPKCGSPTLLDAAFDTDPLVGRVLDERFEVLERLGGGGFGTVYRARQLSVKRDVALKVIRSEWRGDREMAKRFVREAQLVSRLEHPNTIRVFDFGQGADGELYLTMELLRGETLTQRLERVKRFSPAEAARLLACVARSLDEAHAQGIVHRDLKPDNVFLHHPPRGEEVVKVLDFGIAKVTQDGSPVYQTGSLRMLGTPLYMAPEQIRSEPVDGRADLYALGVMLHELLTGRPPFDGASQAEVWHLHQTAEPPELPAEVPLGLRALCTRLLAKRQEDRPASAEVVLGALDDAAKSRPAPVVAPPEVPLAAAASGPAPVEPDPLDIVLGTRGGLDDLVRGRRLEPLKREPAQLPESEEPRRTAPEPESKASLPRPKPPAAPDPGPGPEPVVPRKVAPPSPPPRAAPVAREADLVRPAPRPAPAPPPARRSGRWGWAVAAILLTAGGLGGVAALDRLKPKKEVPKLPAAVQRTDLFVRIEAGKFTMGSPDMETARDPDEVSHTVEITRPFWLGAYEVTQREWSAIMGSNPSKHTDCASCPVENVSWTTLSLSATSAARRSAS